jgi:hypothetical protein
VGNAAADDALDLLLGLLRLGLLGLGRHDQ